MMMKLLLPLSTVLIIALQLAAFGDPLVINGDPVVEDKHDITILPLHGHVHKTRDSILDPKGFVLPGQTTSVNLQGKADSGNITIDDSWSKALFEQKKYVESGQFALPMGTASQRDEKTPSTAGGSVEPGSEYEQKPLKGHQVTLRLTTYQTLIGCEIPWECLRDGIKMLDDGADVTIMLDREGVRLANRHNNQEYQIHRGSTEELIPEQTLFREFVDKGGKIIASERWTKTFGLTWAQIPTGVQLLSDEDMAVELAKRRSQLIEY